jgi:hypothetical protein
VVWGIIPNNKEERKMTPEEMSRERLRLMTNSVNSANNAVSSGVCDSCGEDTWYRVRFKGEDLCEECLCKEDEDSPRWPIMQSNWMKQQIASGRFRGINSESLKIRRANAAEIVETRYSFLSEKEKKRMLHILIMSKSTYGLYGKRSRQANCEDMKFIAMAEKEAKKT